MRTKLIKLLRNLEEQDFFQNFYADNLGDPENDYEVEEHVDFPNYKLIERCYGEKYLTSEYKGLVPAPSRSTIRAELKRMEMDGLLVISEQKATIYAHYRNNCGSDYDDGSVRVSESIILTTRGKNIWHYFLYKAKENPITLIIALIGFIISIIAL